MAKPIIRTVRDLIAELSKMPQDVAVGTIDSQCDEMNISSISFFTGPRYGNRYDRVLITITDEY